MHGSQLMVTKVTLFKAIVHVLHQSSKQRVAPYIPYAGLARIRLAAQLFDSVPDNSFGS